MDFDDVGEYELDVGGGAGQMSEEDYSKFAISSFTFNNPCFAFSDYLLQAYHDQQELASSYSLAQGCIVPTISSAFTSFLGPILICNLFTWLLVSLNRVSFKFKYLEKLLFIGSGLSLIHHHLQENQSLVQFAFVCTLVLIVAISLALYSLRFQRVSLINPMVWIGCLTLITVNEAIIWNGHQEWKQFRPLAMLMVMKSVCYFTEVSSSSNAPVWLGNLNCARTLVILMMDFGVYLLHPSSLLFGVWHPIGTLVNQSKVDTGIKGRMTCFARKVVRVLINLLAASCFLVASTCWIDYYLNHLLDTLLVMVDHFPVVEGLGRAYLVALQFHCSHYFVCFAAQATMALWDIK